MVHANLPSVILPSTFPYHLGDEVILAKYFITNLSKVMYFAIVDRNEDDPIAPK